MTGHVQKNASFRARADGHCMSWCVWTKTFQNTNTKHHVLLYAWARSFQNTSGVCLFRFFSWEKASSDLTSSLQCSGSRVLEMVKWSLNVGIVEMRLELMRRQIEWLPNGRSMFIPRSREKRTDGGSEQRLLLLRQQFGEKETEGCCRWAKQCQRLQNSLKRLLAGWFRCQGELLRNSL